MNLTRSRPWPRRNSQELLANPAAVEVLKAFIPKVGESTLTYERFREITKAVQKETGKKGKDLFHPIRMAVTGQVPDRNWKS